MKVLAEKVRKISPYKLENVDYSKVFYKLSEVNRIRRSLKIKDYCKEIVEIFGLIIFTRNGSIKQYESASQLFLLSPIGEREDIKDFFFKLSNLNQNQDLIFWEKKRVFIFKNIFVRFFCLIIWFIQLYPKVSFYEILLCLKSFLRILEVDNEIEYRLECKKYKVVTFLCDALYVDNYLAQKFRKRNILTVTLQHGIMLAPRFGLENNLDYIGVEFKSSVCDKFLIWNKFTLNEGIKSGINPDVFEILGLIKCLGKEEINISHSNKNVFGVILDGKLSDNNNIPMIKISNQFAKKHNLKFIVRFHPAYSTHEFDNFIDFHYGQICDKGVDLINFLQKVDFSIVSNSTVLFEMAYLKHPVIKYSSGDITDKFIELNYPHFDSYQKLEMLYHNLSSKNTVQLFDELCGSISDISYSYRNFYSQYL